MKKYAEKMTTEYVVCSYFISSLYYIDGVLVKLKVSGTRDRIVGFFLNSCS